MIATLWIVMTAALLTGETQQQAPPAEPPARVNVVLFSDFQCPYCARFAQPFRELQTNGVEGVETTVQFKNFPLPMHPKAQLAHQAAMAAGEQGQFWPMHDLLFANLQRAQREDLLGYARQLDLDMVRFETDMDSERIKQMIAADVAEGSKLGVNGTPTYTINGKAYSGTKSLDQLRHLIGGEERRARILAEISDSVMSKGPADAPVTLELFVDLQSPVSQPAIAVVHQVMQRYPETVRLQFRNFPLSFHPQAALAHEAAMTAARHGRFWEFATFILGHQASLREQDLIAYAGRLGLDATQFAATIRDRRYAPRVDADVTAGLNRGIRGSPVILVNDKRIDGVPSLQTLTEYVEAALTAQPANQPTKP
jgi:protein-disulfide isomerase